MIRWNYAGMLHQCTGSRHIALFVVTQAPRVTPHQTAALDLFVTQAPRVKSPLHQAAHFGPLAVKAPLPLCHTPVEKRSAFKFSLRFPYIFYNFPFLVYTRGMIIIILLKFIQ